MKKFLSMLVLSTVLLTSFSTPVSAEETNVAATAAYAETAPVIDGEIDAVWDTTEAITTDIGYIEGGTAYCTAKVLWTENTIYYLAVVDDPTIGGADVLGFWISETASNKDLFYEVAGDYFLAANGATGETQYYNTAVDYRELVECKVKTDKDRYVVEMAMPVQTEGLTLAEGDIMGLNITADDDLDGDGARDTFLSWEDPSNPYWEKPSVLNAVRLVKGSAPKASAAYAETAPVIDGKWDAVWDTTEAMYTDIGYIEGGTAYGYAKILWREDTIYYYAVVQDATIGGADVLGFWISETASNKDLFYEVAGDYFLAANGATGETQYYNTAVDYRELVDCKVTTHKDYYVVEMAMPVQTENYTLKEGKTMSFNVTIDDDLDGDGARDTFLSWEDPSNPYWEKPSVLQGIKLVKKVENPTVNGDPEAATSSDNTGNKQDDASQSSSAATEQPTTTDAPAVEEPASGNTGLIVGIVIAVVLVAAIVAWVVARKKK